MVRPSFTHTSTLQTAALATLEQVINRALALDPRSIRALARLEGSVIALRSTQPPFQAFLLPTHEGVDIMSQWEGDITTEVSGRAADFAALATAADPAAALINGNLNLYGDSGPLIELQKILKGLDLDWEAPLTDNLGDVVGHQLAEGLRGLFSASRRAHSSLERQLEEFIHEEARLAPPRLELEDFYTGVGTLVERTERLQSRIERLRKQLRQLSPPAERSKQP
ncbi:MAG: SCP2 domain-containing protein [Parahaliea sp.]